MLSKEGFDALGPVFAMNGWVFFGPYRRGQGLSASVGKYIGDEIAAATKTGGLASGSAKMVRLLETDHLNDQVAALTWLRTQKFVEADRTAVAGNSFGGIEAELGASTPTTIVDDAQCSQFPRANFFLSGREGLRPSPEPRSFGRHEGRWQGIRAQDLSSLW